MPLVARTFYLRRYEVAVLVASWHHRAKTGLKNGVLCLKTAAQNR
ncbi:hypothetical protein [Nostoc sp. TCL240-02]|nr:hypothetical protein [Nostoc sp. TCL240-02]